MKRGATEWEKMSAKKKKKSYRRPESIIYKGLLQYNNKNTNSLPI